MDDGKHHRIDEERASGYEWKLENLSYMAERPAFLLFEMPDAIGDGQRLTE
jgi:hypothetical protein